MLDDATRREVTRIAELVAVRAARETVRVAPTTGLLTQPSWVMGTLGADCAPGANVTVRIDGDVVSLPNGAQNVTGERLMLGQRVVVLVRATGGALITNTVGSHGWTVIDVATVTGSSSRPTFTVPQTYDMLRLSGYARGTGAAAGVNLYVEINGDTTAANYYTIVSTGATIPGTVAGLFICTIYGNTATANRFAAFEAILPGYRTAIQKPMRSSGGYYDTSSNASTSAGLWLGTAPVTQLKLGDSPANNLAVGSQIILEGLRAAA